MGNHAAHEIDVGLAVWVPNQIRPRRRIRGLQRRKSGGAEARAVQSHGRTAEHDKGRCNQTWSWGFHASWKMEIRRNGRTFTTGREARLSPVVKRAQPLIGR